MADSDPIDPIAAAILSAESLLNDIAHLLSRHVVFPHDEARDAVVLWIAYTHVHECFDTSPRLAVLSPEKGSGKTRLLEVLDTLCKAPLRVLSVSPAALFRLVPSQKPTLLLDEVDAIFGVRQREHEDLRALLNGGYRRGASVIRCVGGEGTKLRTESFPSFCPVALAGIGDLPETILSRSVRINMRRRSAAETVHPWRIRHITGVTSDLHARLVLWADGWHGGWQEDVASLNPVMPKGVEDRQADNWEPLLAVAEACGGAWAERGRAAAERLVAEAAADDPSLGARLLADIRAVFDECDGHHLPSAELARKLGELEESPWGDVRGTPIDARSLAARVRPYGIRPHSVRVGMKTPKGYSREDFVDAWNRYLAPPPEPQHPQQSAP